MCVRCVHAIVSLCVCVFTHARLRSCLRRVRVRACLLVRGCVCVRVHASFGACALVRVIACVVRACKRARGLACLLDGAFDRTRVRRDDV